MVLALSKTCFLLSSAVCNCNGHSRCYPGTSTCIECQNNTKGKGLPHSHYEQQKCVCVCEGKFSYEHFRIVCSKLQLLTAFANWNSLVICSCSHIAWSHQIRTSALKRVHAMQLTYDMNLVGAACNLLHLRSRAEIEQEVLLCNKLRRASPNCTNDTLCLHVVMVKTNCPVGANCEQCVDGLFGNPRYGNNCSGKLCMVCTWLACLAK